MFGISWKLEKEASKDLYGNQRFDTFSDFPSKQKLKEFVEKEISNICCSSCGGKRIRAKKITIYFRKVYFYKQVEKDALFGRKKKVDVLDKIIFRLNGSYLADTIKCKSCGEYGYGFPSIKFLSLALSSAQNILSLIENMPRSERVAFSSEKLVREAVHRPVKMKELLHICQNRIEYYRKNDDYDNERKYQEIFADLGAVAGAVL